MKKKPISKKKVDALMRHGARLKAPAEAQEPIVAKPIQEGKLFSKDDIKEIMIEAMKIATKQERRGTSRLIVKRDGRGFIDTVDVVPVDVPVTLN